MSIDNFESVWFMLNEYEWQVDVSDRSNVSCVLCGSVLTEAVRSVGCGCRFCRRCLEMRLAGGSDKRCPGRSAECPRTLLDLPESILPDDDANRAVCGLRVHCPFDSCGHEDELARMDVHLGLCRARPALSGCCCASLKNKELVNHVRIEEIVHLRLLIESIDNLRNDNKLLQMEMSANKRESDEKRIIIDKLQSDIGEINLKLEQIIINQKMMSEKLDDLCLERCADTRPKSTDPERVNCSVNNHSINNVTNPIGELIWKIDNFMSRKNDMLIGKIRWLDSEVFVTSPNMYKMKLRLWIGEATVDMMVKMLPEDNPDCRRWPIMCDVKVGMINPDTQEFFINDSRIIEYKTFYFSSKSSFQFQISSIKKNVLRNDVLIIKCVINERDLPACC